MLILIADSGNSTSLSGRQTYFMGLDSEYEPEESGDGHQVGFHFDLDSNVIKDSETVANTDD